MLPVALRLHRNPLQLLSQYIAQKKEVPEALEKMLPFLSCFRVSKYPMKTTDAVPKTTVFGTSRTLRKNSRKVPGFVYLNPSRSQSSKNTPA
jgi:hypothetical protein